MEHLKELSLLRDALHSNNIQEAVNVNSRRILKERVNSGGFYDVILQDIVLDIISCIQIPVTFKLSEQPVSGIVKSQGDKSLTWLKWLMVAAIGFVMTFFPLWSILGGIILCVAGFGLKVSLTSSHIPSTPQLVCVSTEFELMQSIDAVYEKLYILFNHNQLEGRHKDVLVWLQRLFSDDDDEKYRVEFLKLMSVLGYEFVEYSDDVSDNFEVSDANVSEIVTSKYAIRNKATGKFVLPGVVVFPK